MGDRALKDILFSHFHRQCSALSLGGILLLGLGGINACNSAPLSPAARPSPLQTATPSPSPTMAVQPSTSISPALLATAMPLASPTQKPIETPPVIPIYLAFDSDGEGLDYATFSGQIFDDNFKPLKEVHIQARSLNKAVPYSAQTIALDGQYTFNRIPSGIQVEITASKPGYTTRKRVEVPKSDYRGAGLNRFDFGSASAEGSVYASPELALSDKPEVTEVSFSQTAEGIPANASFSLKFSEPMNPASVENHWVILSAHHRQLSADQDNPNRAYTLPDTPIFDKNAFQISWNAENTEAKFQFRAPLRLPTDKDKTRIPRYQLAFRTPANEAGAIQDQRGVNRSAKHFRLNSASEFVQSEFVQFDILPDPVLPEVKQFKLAPDLPVGAGYIVEYSKPMLQPILNLKIVGGMAGLTEAYRQAPATVLTNGLSHPDQVTENYQFKIVNFKQDPVYQGSWGRLGGKVAFLAEDPFYQQVLLQLPVYTGPDLPAVYLNSHELISAEGAYHTGPEPDQYHLYLIRPNAELVPMTITLPANLTNNGALATALETQLNNQAQNLIHKPAQTAFSVKIFSTTGGNPALQGRFLIRFHDTLGTYLGFAFQAAPASNDTGEQLPQLQTGGLKWFNGKAPALLKADDRVELTVAGTVIDPAGNALDPAKQNATLFVYEN